VPRKLIAALLVSNVSGATSAGQSDLKEQSGRERIEPGRGKRSGRERAEVLEHRNVLDAAAIEAIRDRGDQDALLHDSTSG